MPNPSEFFDLNDFDHKSIFIEEEEVWTVLNRLKDYLASFFQDSWPLSGISGLISKTVVIHEDRVMEDLEVRPTGPKGTLQAYMNNEVLEGAAIVMPGAFLDDDRVILGPGSMVESGALVKGPTVIGKGSEVRQGAYMRGDCLVGDGCVVGHTTEIKGSIMIDGAKAGHFAYIGDSILGRNVNLGAGTKLANLKMIAGSVVIRRGKTRYDTGRRKIGAILGDRTETGCNSVTSPGTIMGKKSIVYPALTVPSGYYPGRAVFTPPRGSVRVNGRAP